MSYIEQSKGKANMEQSMRLIAMSIVDENNEPMFTEETLSIIKKKNMQVILRLQEAVLKLNGMATDEKDKGAKEKEVKND